MLVRVDLGTVCLRREILHAVSALCLQGCSTQHRPMLRVRHDSSAAASPANGGDCPQRTARSFCTTRIARLLCTRGRDHRPSAWAATWSCRTSATGAETPGAACGTSTEATWQSCQEEQRSTSPSGSREAEASVAACRQLSLLRSCLLPTKDELGKKIIVMLIICTKVTRSHLVLLPQLAAAEQGGINNINGTISAKGQD